MSLQQRVITALHNGVSRQPPVLRAADQTEDELNTYSVVSKGVAKRPPTEDVSALGNIPDGAFVHHINRDVTERYLVIISGGAIRVLDAETGDEKTVNAPDGLAYVSDGSFRAVSVADYTFIVNTERTCRMLGTIDAQDVESPNSRWINRSGDWAEPDAIPTNDLATGFNANYPPNGSTGTYTGSVTSIEKLPETAAEGALYKVAGSSTTGFTTFYVVRRGDAWEETVAPNQRNNIDQSTMPHALVREGDGTFTFAPFSWAPRRVGTPETNPSPTFINRNVRDVFFYQNRLGLLVDENVIFSCAGDFGNFWRNTVLDYVASDVVDVAVTTANVALLNYAIAFNDGIVAFADQVQFSITNGEDGLTPSSVAISPITRYEVNQKVRPVAIGSEIYFAGNQSGSSAVWEYTRLAESEALQAAEITAHVPGLIPPDVVDLIAVPNMKTVVALTGGKDAYIYQFYWNGNEKVVSAWRPWRFAGDVISGTYASGHLYLVVRYPDGARIERMDLQEDAKPAEQNRQVYLDRQLPLDGTYDPVTGTTAFTFPYEPEQSSVRIIRGSGHPYGGAAMDPALYTWDDATTVRVPGEVSETVTGGLSYEMRFTFSRQFPHDYQQRNLTTGRLVLRTFTVNYAESGYFRAVVRPYGDVGTENITTPEKSSTFTGMVVGDNQLQIGQPVYHTGRFSFQVFGDASQATVTLINDSHFASIFVSAEWEGFFQHRALR